MKIRSWECRTSGNRDELWLNWTLRLRDPLMTVGYVQAAVTTARAEVAWLIGVPFQGRGYATEASRRVVDWLSRHLEVSKVFAHIHPEHTASQSIARNSGLNRMGETTDDGEEVWEIYFP